jgi:hypothetical protein
MKALLLASVLFFSLRAMSAQVGEDQNPPCDHANQGKRDSVTVNKEKAETVSISIKKEEPAATSH